MDRQLTLADVQVPSTVSDARSASETAWHFGVLKRLLFVPQADIESRKKAKGLVKPHFTCSVHKDFKTYQVRVVCENLYCRMPTSPVFGKALTKSSPLIERG